VLTLQRGIAPSFSHNCLNVDSMHLPLNCTK
jgi:hypothetical protein